MMGPIPHVVRQSCICGDRLSNPRFRSAMAAFLARLRCMGAAFKQHPAITGALNTMPEK